MEVVVWKIHRFQMGRSSNFFGGDVPAMFDLQGDSCSFSGSRWPWYIPMGNWYVGHVAGNVSRCWPYMAYLRYGQTAATSTNEVEIWEPANKMTIHVRLVNDGKFPQIQWVFKEYSNLSWVWISCPQMNWIPDFLDGGSFTLVLLEMAYDSNLFTPTNAGEICGIIFESPW